MAERVLLGTGTGWLTYLQGGSSLLQFIPLNGVPVSARALTGVAVFWRDLAHMGVCDILAEGGHEGAVA